MVIGSEHVGVLSTAQAEHAECINFILQNVLENTTCVQVVNRIQNRAEQQPSTQLDLDSNAQHPRKVLTTICKSHTRTSQMRRCIPCSAMIHRCRRGLGLRHPHAPMHQAQACEGSPVDKL